MQCADTCKARGFFDHTSDGECADGGPDSTADYCKYGSDCTDCGPRCQPPPAAPVNAPQYPPPPVPPPPPTSPPFAPVPLGLLWAVIEGGDACEAYNLTTPAGFAGYQCIHDGDDNYAALESCTIQAYEDIFVTAAAFNTEAGYDRLYIGDEPYWGTTGPSAAPVSRGQLITFSSDTSVHASGFVLCAIAMNAVVSPSPPPPTPPDYPPNSVTFICTETCNYASDGTCDDGGSGNEFASCAICSDCTDCGPRIEQDCTYPPPPSPAPPLPPSPPPPAHTCGAIVCIESGEEYCELTSTSSSPEAGSCVWDGSGRYTSNEGCLMYTTTASFVAAVQYDVESNYDYLA